MEGESSKTYFFGNDSNSWMPLLATLFSQRGIDPSVLYAMNNSGGFGGGNSFLWIIFLFFLMGWGGNGNFGNFGGNNGTGFLANQLNNDAGRDLLQQAIQGNGDAIRQLSTNLNCDINAIQGSLNSLMSALQGVGSQVGMSGLQVQNAIQMGDASLSRQLCECCCENRLLTTQQGYEAQIRTLEQTNQLGSQADRNTTNILSAIKDQNALILDQFCNLERREYQSKIAAQGDTITQLRGQIDNDRQTAQLYNVIAPLQAKVNEIANKQPNTVPVTYPNITAVNNTPSFGFGWGAGFNPYGYGWGGTSYWG